MIDYHSGAVVIIVTGDYGAIRYITPAHSQRALLSQHAGTGGVALTALLLAQWLVIGELPLFDK